MFRFHKWLSKLFKFSRNQSRRKTTRRPYAPQFEVLEVRCVPAYPTVNSTADNNVRDDVLTFREALLLTQGILGVNQLTDDEAFQIVGITDQLPFTLQGNVIDFDLNTNNEMVISVGSALPTITKPIIIDGTTPDPINQPNQFIRIDGNGLDQGVNGLTIDTDHMKVKGISITRFTGNGIEIKNAVRNNKIEGCYIGTNKQGLADLGNDLSGIFVNNSISNVIGGTDDSQRNVISGNIAQGIRISGEGARYTLVFNNYIGVSPSGILALPNGENGILIRNGAFESMIGRTFDPALGFLIGRGNTISGNLNDGIRMDNANENEVGGNLIGISLGDDTVPKYRVISNGENGVTIRGGSSNNLVGGTSDGERNVISGNAGNGIQIAGNQNKLFGNYIGTDVTGDDVFDDIGNDVGNGRIGVYIEYGNDNQIGGPNAAQRNVISNNGGNGVKIELNANKTKLEQTYIGTKKSDPDSGLPNKAQNVNDLSLTTIYVQNTIGFSPGDGVLVQGGAGTSFQDNVFIGNQGNALHIIDSTEVVIQGNFFGTDEAGTTGLGNGGSGIFLETSTSVDIQNNTIAHSGSAGVAVVSGTGNRILTNSIYANAALGIDLGNDDVTENDQGDADTGPNNLMNFPVFTIATRDGNTVHIEGYVDSPVSTGYIRVQFFDNDQPDPLGHGEGQRFLGETYVSSGETFVEDFTGVHFVSATATDSVGNTSEFSGVAQPSPFHAVDDVYSVYMNMTLEVSAPGVLSNDYYPRENAVTAVVDSQPAFGALIWNGDGSFTYTPNEGYDGQDQFTYHIHMGSENSNVATVYIGLVPWAAIDQYEVLANQTLNIGSAGVLANDVDPYGAPFVAVQNSFAAHGTANLNADGSFSFNPDHGFVGLDWFSYYFVDSAGRVSNVATVYVNVKPLPSQTTWPATPSSSVYGQPITFSVAVSAMDSSVTDGATGPVEFFAGNTSLGSADLDENGVASLSVSSLGVGTFSIKAIYHGDNLFANSQADMVTVTVNKGDTTITLDSDQPSAVRGTPVTFTATVTVLDPGAGLPTGTVLFYKGTTVIGTGTLDDNGQATFTIATLPVGTFSMAGYYQGDAHFNASGSDALPQTITRATTVTVVASSPSASVYGQAVTCTATVSATVGSLGTPTSTVTIYAGDTALGSGPLDASGVASVTVTTLPLGQISLSAVYGGDAGFADSTAEAVTHQVNQSSSAVALTSDHPQAEYATPIIVTATVAALAPGSGTTAPRRSAAARWTATASTAGPWRRSASATTACCCATRATPTSSTAPARSGKRSPRPTAPRRWRRRPPRRCSARW